MHIHLDIPSGSTASAIRRMEDLAGAQTGDRAEGCGLNWE